MFRVVISAALPVDLRPALPSCEVRAPAAGRFSRAELEDALGDADALICLLTDRIDEALLARAPKLRVIANHAVGVDNIDLPAATRRGIMVANTPDVLTEATADLTFALLLASARRLVEADAMVRARAWSGWEPGLLLGADVHGRTLGIVGMGRIGQAVARRARGFAMSVVYSAPRQVSGDARRVALEALLGESDFVSLHCPLTDETRGLFDAHRLAQMKSNAHLINTARGALVDEEALAVALDAGRLGGAGLDVFAHEPAVHPRLLRQPRVVLAPHVGSATVAARTRMAELCAEAVRDVVRGRAPRHWVNPT